MRKRILSLILAVVLLIPSFMFVIAADETAVIVNEVFDDYATNNTEVALESESGIDGRVIEEDKDKVYFIRAWEEDAGVKIPVKSAEKKLVFSADIKVTGVRTTGEFFTLTDSAGNGTPLLSVNDSGRLAIADGKEVCGLSYDKWMNFQIIADFANKKLTVIKDGDVLIKDWITKPLNVSYVNELHFLLTAPSDSKETDLYIDDIRVYTGDEVKDNSFFPKKVRNNEVLEFTETLTMDAVGSYVFADYNLDGGTSVLTPFGKTKLTSVKEENGNGYGLFERTGELINAYADIYLNDEQKKIIAKTRGLVMEVDIMPVEIEGTNISILSGRSIEGGFSGGFSITSDLGYEGETLPVGKWSKLGVIVNYKDMVKETYINGELVSSTKITTKRPKLGSFRIDIPGKGGDVIFGVDNIKIYEGIELKKADPDAPQAPASPVANFKSVMEKDEDAQKLIGDRLVLMLTNGMVYYDGVKSELEDKPYVTDGTTMVPVRFISEKLGCDVKWDDTTQTVTINDNCTMTIGDKNIKIGSSAVESIVAPEIKNSRTYLPLRVLCEQVLGKFVLYDLRDMVIVSDEVCEYTDSTKISEIDEPIDIIFRYMQFDRPKGDEIISLLKQRHPNNSHPRLAMTNELMAELQEKVANDALCSEWARKIIDRAEVDYNLPVAEYYKRDGLRILPVSWVTQEKFERWTMAYWLTGDKRYADRAWLEIEATSNFPDWNDKAHFLDTAELCNAYALAYDAFYDVWSDGQKKLMRDTLYEKAFLPALDAYQGNHPNGYWVKGDDNWTSVCPGGLLVAALTIVDDGDYEDVLSVIIENSVQSFEYILGLFYPDGAWYETVGYLNYTLHHVAHGIGGLYNATGNDYNFYSAKGFADVGPFVLYMLGPKNGAFGYHDGSAGYTTEETYFWLARAVGDYDFMESNMLMAINYNEATPELFPYGLLWYKPADTTAEIELPLDRFYQSAYTGSMRRSWDNKDDEYVGVHGGYNHIDHDQLDLGSFIYESDGIRWAYDIGSDNYDLPGYFSLQGYNIYRKRPEGNNCLLINPREGYFGQYLDAFAPPIRFEGNDNSAIAVFDLSDAYRDDASSVTRGFYFGEDRRTLTIRDEIRGIPDNSDVYFLIHTPAKDIEIDGSTAILSMDGKQCRLEVASNADSVEILNMDAEPFPTSPVVEGQADNSNFRRITIKFKASGDVDIAVKLIPIKDGVNAVPVNLTPISDWSVN